MKRLFATNISEITLPDHLIHDSKIALKSAAFKIHRNSIFDVQQEFSVNLRKVGTPKIVEQIIFRTGKYTLQKIVDQINNNSLKLALEVLENGVAKFSVNSDFQVQSENDELWKILGIGVAPQAWVGPGNLFGKPLIGDSFLHLVFDEMDDEDNFLDGKKSKIFQSFPLFDNTTYVVKEYENPVYVPIRSSTDRLHFHFDPIVETSHLMFEFLIK